MSPYLRTVKTISGATAVQIVHSSHRGSRDIDHIGSAHDNVELELLKAFARQWLAAGQGELDLGLATAAPGGPLPITSTRMGVLLDCLERAYRVLGFDRATGGDEVFLQLVLARIIEPVSKLDSARVLKEAGIAPAPYRAVTRRLRAFADVAGRRLGRGHGDLVVEDPPDVVAVAGDHQRTALGRDRAADVLHRRDARAEVRAGGALRDVASTCG